MSVETARKHLEGPHRAPQPPPSDAAARVRAAAAAAAGDAGTDGLARAIQVRA